MNSSFFKSLKHLILGCILCLTFTVLFTSCENFLKASEIREEIEKVIDYNNAQLVNVLIHSEERIGSFLVEGEKEFKINHTVAEVQFTANNKVCIFEGLEAVSKTDTSISRNDCVEIKKISGNKDTGVYTYTIKVTQKQNDILIKPVYQLRPSVVNISPLYTNDPTDPIVITFDVPVEDKDSKKETPLFDFSNISIKYGNTDITDKFNEPVLSEDKTFVTITPDSAKFNNFLDENSNVTYADINISLDPRTLFDVNGNYLYFAEDNSLNFTVHYVTGFEIAPPVKDEFGVYKDWDTTTDSGDHKFTLRLRAFQDDFAIYNKFYYEGDFPPWEGWDDAVIPIPDNQFADHITDEYVYIYGKYYDNDNDVKTIEVEEYFNDDLNPECYEEHTSYITKKYTKDSDEVILWNKYSNGRIAFCIKKKLLSPDGIIRLRTTVKDTYGNPATTQEVCVIKSTSIRFFTWATLINVTTERYMIGGSGPKDFDMEMYENELRDIKFIYYDYDYEKYGEDVDELINENYVFWPKYGYKCINPESVFKSIKCQYYKDNGELVTRKMEFQPYGQYVEYEEEGETVTKIEWQDGYETAIKWHYTIPETDVADLNHLKIKIIIEDIIGNTFSEDYTFPGRTVVSSDDEIFYSSSWSEYRRRILKLSETDNAEVPGLIVFKSGNSWKTKYFGSNNIELKQDYLPIGTEYYLVSTDSDKLTAPLNEKFVVGGATSGTHLIEYDKISYELKEDEKILINIKIKDSSLNYFDSIFLKFGGEDRALNQFQTYYLSKGEKSIKFLKNTSTLFAEPQKIILYGIKDGVCSISEDIHIQKFTDPKYDNIAPTIEWPQIDIRFPEYYMFDPIDRQSGVSRISINDITFDSPVNTDGKNYSYIVNFNNGKITLQPVEVTDEPSDSLRVGAILLHLYDVIDYSLGFPCVNFEIKVYDKANNVCTKKINKKIEQETPVTITNGINSNSWTFNKQNFNVSIFINNNWQHKKYSVGYGYNYSSISNYFVRLYDECSIPTYYYKTSSTHDYSNDSLALTGSSTQMRVSSNDPVLVQTIVTPRSYSVCKDWSKEEWMFFKKIVDDEVFNLSSSNKRATYNIPLDQINQDECYVVIAHFADGSSIISDVMVKE